METEEFLIAKAKTEANLKIFEGNINALERKIENSKEQVLHLTQMALFLVVGFGFLIGLSLARKHLRALGESREQY